MARNIEVLITGNSRGLEQAFDRSAEAARGFSGDVAVTAAKATAGAYALTQALEGAAAASKVFSGENTEMTRGLESASKGISSLLRLDFEGFFDAANAGANRMTEGFEKGAAAINTYAEETRALDLAARLAAAGLDEYATMLEKAAIASQMAVKPQVFGSEFGIGFLAGSPYQPLKTQRPLGPAEKRELALIRQQGMGRLPGLQDRLGQLRGQLEGAKLHKDRLRISTQIAQTEREIAGIYTAQAATLEAARKARAAEDERLRKEAAERRRRAREAAAAAEQARQYRLIGLGPTGDEIIPGRGNLQRQLGQLQARSGELPSKITNRFAGIAKALRDPKLKSATRDAIRDFFRFVRGEFDKVDDALKPVAVRGLNTGQVVRGLGLSAAQNRKIQNRLAGVNVAGQALADVYLDGEKVGRVNKRYGQRDKINSPKQKRGPNAGR